VTDPFADLLAANRTYAEGFDWSACRCGPGQGLRTHLHGLPHRPAGGPRAQGRRAGRLSPARDYPASDAGQPVPSAAWALGTGP